MPRPPRSRMGVVAGRVGCPGRRGLRGQRSAQHERMSGHDTEDPGSDEGGWRSRPERTCHGVDAITRHRLGMLDLDVDALRLVTPRGRLDRVYRRFVERVPYETLSNHLACREQPDEPSTWPRATDRLLRENVRCGLGGTSFSLAYALRDLLRGVGGNAHCTLGRNLVTEEMHATVIAYAEDGAWLYDPALLAGGPLAVCPGGALLDPLGTLRLEPGCGKDLVVTVSLPGAPEPRSIYTLVPLPAPPHRFRQAWIASFGKGRRPVLSIARRVEDEIRRYTERPHRLEILTAEGHSYRPLPSAPVEELHALFGIDSSCLRDWFGDAS